MAETLKKWKYEILQAKKKYNISEDDYKSIEVSILQAIYYSHLEGFSNAIKENKETITDLKKEVEKWQVMTSRTESRLWKMIFHILKNLLTKSNMFSKSKQKTL